MDVICLARISCVESLIGQWSSLNSLSHWGDTRFIIFKRLVQVAGPIALWLIETDSRICVLSRRMSSKCENLESSIWLFNNTMHLVRLSISFPDCTKALIWFSLITTLLKSRIASSKTFSFEATESINALWSTTILLNISFNYLVGLLPFIARKNCIVSACVHKSQTPSRKVNTDFPHCDNL